VSLAVGALTAVALGGAIAPAAAAEAASPASITVYPVTPPGSNANDQAVIECLTPGPGGDLWFTWNIDGDTYGLGRITTSGVVSTYPGPSGFALHDIAYGGGDLWVTETSGGGAYIGEWSPVGTQLQYMSLPGASALGIAWGPDGALWFTGVSPTSGRLPGAPPGGFIGRMTPEQVVTNGGWIQWALPPNASGGDPTNNDADDIIEGPDGALWFDLPTQGEVGRITTSGTITEYPIPGAEPAAIDPSDQSLTVGPDGAVWVGATWTGGLARAAGGTVTSYPIDSTVRSLTTGADGNLWLITDSDVETLSTAGTVTGVYPLPADVQMGMGGTGITSGPDGALWFSADGEIGRLGSAVTPPASPTPTPLPAPSATPGSGLVSSTAPTPAPPSSLTSTPVGSPSASPQPAAVRPTATPSRPGAGGFAWPAVVVVALVVLLGAAAGGILLRRRLTQR
jgi:virginiamycin B lyase